MTRILHIATRFRRGGAERNIAHVIDWERRAGFDVELAVGPDSELTLVPRGIRTHRINALVRRVDPVRDIKALVEVRRLIGAGEYDILHTHLSKAGVVGRVAGKGMVPKIAHTVHMSSFGPGYSKPASIAFRSAERYTSSVTALFAFVGAELRAQYIAGRIVEAARTAIVRSLLDLEGPISTRSWAREQRIEARRSLGIPTDETLLISVGVLEHRKRHRLLIERLAPMLREGHARLVIAGAGDQTMLRRRAGELDVQQCVTFTGHLDDVTPLFGAADALIHTAEVEGVPQAVLQGLAAGLPVVATKVVGLTEVRGSQVAIVPTTGQGLGAAVKRQLEEPPRPVPLSAFDEWSASAVDCAISEFHDRLGS